MSNKRHQTPGAPGVQLGLIITPMLDMSFQILFFFVMTYHPSALEGQLEMLLPATGQAKADKIENVDPKAAWNLGMKAGLRGHASLVPLAAVWTACGVWLSVAGRARRPKA